MAMVEGGDIADDLGRFRWNTRVKSGAGEFRRMCRAAFIGLAAGELCGSGSPASLGHPVEVIFCRDAKGRVPLCSHGPGTRVAPTLVSRRPSPGAIRSSALLRGTLQKAPRSRANLGRLRRYIAVTSTRSNVCACVCVCRRGALHTGYMTQATSIVGPLCTAIVSALTMHMRNRACTRGHQNDSPRTSKTNTYRRAQRTTQRSLGAVD